MKVRRKEPMDIEKRAGLVAIFETDNAFFLLWQRGGRAWLEGFSTSGHRIIAPQVSSVEEAEGVLKRFLQIPDTLGLIQDAAESIAFHPQEEWVGWITYLLECLDGKVEEFEPILEAVQEAISTRLKEGIW